MRSTPWHEARSDLLGQMPRALAGIALVAWTVYGKLGLAIAALAWLNPDLVWDHQDRGN